MVNHSEILLTPIFTIKKRFSQFIVFTGVLSVLFLLLKIANNEILNFLDINYEEIIPSIITPQEAFSIFPEFTIITLLTYGIWTITSIVIFTGLIVFMMYSLDDLQKNKNISYKSNIDKALDKSPQVLYTGGLSLILLMVLYALFIIPGIIFTIFWLFAIPITLFTNAKGFTALKESTQLLYNKWWNTFLLFIITIILLRILYVFITQYIEPSIMSLISQDVVEFIFLFGIHIVKTILVIYGVLLLLELYSKYSQKTTQSSSREEIAKNYIQQYRGSFSKQAIKNALEEEFNNRDEAEQLVEKYY